MAQRFPDDDRPYSLDVVIATDDVAYLASVLRGEIAAEDVDLVDTRGIEIGLQPALFDHDCDGGEVIIEARAPSYHLIGGCDGTLASQIADSLDGSSGVQVPVTLSARVSDAPESGFIDVAVFFVAEGH